MWRPHWGKSWGDGKDLKSGKGQERERYNPGLVELWSMCWVSSAPEELSLLTLTSSWLLVSSGRESWGHLLQMTYCMLKHQNSHTHTHAKILWELNSFRKEMPCLSASNFSLGLVDRVNTTKTLRGKCLHCAQVCVGASLTACQKETSGKPVTARMWRMYSKVGRNTVFVGVNTPWEVKSERGSYCWWYLLAGWSRSFSPFAYKQ